MNPAAILDQARAAGVVVRAGDRLRSRGRGQASLPQSSLRGTGGALHIGRM
jgi:hypothetical protein